MTIRIGIKVLMSGKGTNLDLKTLNAVTEWTEWGFYGSTRWADSFFHLLQRCSPPHPTPPLPSPCLQMNCIISVLVLSEICKWSGPSGPWSDDWNFVVLSPSACIKPTRISNFFSSQCILLKKLFSHRDHHCLPSLTENNTENNRTTQRDEWVRIRQCSLSPS